MKIHSTAIIHDNVEIGPDVEIGAFSIIYNYVKIGKGTVIGSHCEIGLPTPLAKSENTILGEKSLIRSGTVIYQGSKFGEKLETGHKVTIRENTLSGEDLKVGTLSDVQGDVQIGRSVRFHSNVHIGKMSYIGDFVWVYPYVVLTNDPQPPSENLIGVRVDDFAVIATMSVILPGISIGKNSLIGANSLVNKDIPAGVLALGSPARIISEVTAIRKFGVENESAYPWRRHFHRGYKPSDIETWKEEFRDGNSSNNR